MNIMVFVAIALAAGGIAGILTKGSGFGTAGDCIAGIPGSLLGRFVLGAFGIAGGGLLGQIATAIAGSVGLLVLLQAVRRVLSSLAASGTMAQPASVPVRAGPGEARRARRPARERP